MFIAPRNEKRPMHVGLWRRFMGRRTTRWGVSILAGLVAISLASLPFSTRWFSRQSLDEAVRHGPSWEPLLAPLAPLDPDEGEGDLSETGLRAFGAYWAWRASSWFGHDDLGRSVFHRVWLGFLISLGIGFVAAAIAVFLGTAWGATAGIVGGKVDGLLMRVVDVLYGLPYILMVILLQVGLTKPLYEWLGRRDFLANLVVLLLAISAVSWLSVARVVRGQVLSLRERAFVEAAIASGASRVRVVTRHLLPNLLGPITVYGALAWPQAMLQESFLSFLGIGIAPPLPSLGQLAADGIEAVNAFVGYWWLLLFPCGLLVVTLVALNLLGDALRDAWDPNTTGVPPV